MHLKHFNLSNFTYILYKRKLKLNQIPFSNFQGTNYYI